MSTIEVGELLYEYTVRFSGMTEYGVSFAALMAGTTAPPPEGARFDVAFAGTSVGPRLKGKVAGVDYLRVRADGRFELHIHAEITTEDGEKISLHADGVAQPKQGSPVAGLRENVTLLTSSKAYAWVNPLQVWATGTVDLGEQVVHLKGYSAQLSLGQEVPTFLHGYEEGMPFQRYLALLAEQERGLDLPSPRNVPSTFLFAFVGPRIGGRASIRHRLTEALARRGGHIGTERLLLTCDDDNIGSIKTIERNGGILEDVVRGPDLARPLRRYWIDLGRPRAR